jgi:hypothetical protein
MNVGLLQQIRREILAEPMKFNMGGWGVMPMANDRSYRISIDFYENLTPEDVDRFRRDTETVPRHGYCYTTACIGGWATLLSAQEHQIRMSSTYEAAREVLELDTEASYRLFLIEQWPEPFKSEYESRTATPRERAEAAALRIDRFIATEGRE